MISYFEYNFQLAGKLIITEEDGAVTAVSKYAAPFGKRRETALILAAKRQIEEYFSGERLYFTLPLKMRGTEFQLKIWNALQKIPYGTTIAYNQLAALAGSPKACRAVGSACNRNPICIIVPCHRVIGADGKLTGYAYGTEMKQKLLELENKYRR